MTDREEVKDIVRELEKLHHAAFADEDGKTEISFDLLSRIFSMIVSDYHITKQELET